MNKILKFIKIYILLIQFDINLRSKGFAKVFDKYVKKYEYIKNRQYKQEDIERINNDIKNVLVLVELACTLYPSNARCIHRAFLSYRILRSKYRVPLRLVIGVCHFPFEAHAWIMQGKYNIGEEDADTVKYSIILDSSNYLKEGEVS